jgi:uncharacterized protein (DUF1015 family)
MDIQPFRALRARPDLAAAIACPPYDVLDTDEARRLAAGDPRSFLRVEKPEIVFDAGTDPYDERVYAAGRDALTDMVDQGWLVRDREPTYSVYRMTMGEHVQTGIAAVASVADYDAGRIRRHEHTRPDKEADRARHIVTLSAQTGPILMAYRGVPELNAVVTGVTAADPAVDFTAADGVGHALWPVADPAACARIEATFQKIGAAYIADGHHRAAAASRVARERRAAIPGGSGDASSDRFLAVLFPHSQLRILGYHRLVRDLNGLDPGGFIERLRSSGFVVKDHHRTRRPPHQGAFSVYLPGSWSLVQRGPEIALPDDPRERLDVSVLSELVLRAILGVEDPRTDRRIEFVGGATGRGVDELERRVDSGEHAVGFALFPTSIEDVMSVADAGRVMPPKSTWFEPKLRSGLLVHTI